MPAEGELVILHGRRIVSGTAEGEALVTEKRVSGWGGIDPETGDIIDERHELYGKNIKGKVFVFPSGKGSSSWAALLIETSRKGNGPVAVINQKADTLIVTSVILSNIPTMVDIDQDPCQAIRTGDWVRVDADRGRIEVRRRKQKCVFSH